jgi:hypothetical protein
LSKDTGNRNFTLGQSGDLYDSRLRTTATSTNGTPSVAAPAGSLTEALTHVVYIRNAAGAARIYVNGSQVSSKTVGGDLSSWNETYHLGLANEMTMDRPWFGELHLVAVYNRALDPQEVNQNFQAGANPSKNQTSIPVDSNNDSYSGEPENVKQDPQTAQDVKTWIEAEDGILNYPMEYAWDSSASSEGFIWVPNGSGNAMDPSQESGYAEYNFMVPVDGNYVIWGRVEANNSADNSFFVSVDDKAYALWHTRKSQSWVWDPVNTRGAAEPVVYQLDAGEHTLIIKQREDGTKIDSILITGDMEFVPE